MHHDAPVRVFPAPRPASIHDRRVVVVGGQLVGPEPEFGVGEIVGGEVVEEPVPFVVVEQRQMRSITDKAAVVDVDDGHGIGSCNDSVVIAIAAGDLERDRWGAGAKPSARYLPAQSHNRSASASICADTASCRPSSWSRPRWRRWRSRGRRRR